MVLADGLFTSKIDLFTTRNSLILTAIVIAVLVAVGIIAAVTRHQDLSRDADEV